MLNRYPLMDVSYYFTYNFVAFCKEKHFLRDSFAALKIFSTGIQIYARQFSVAG